MNIIYGILKRKKLTIFTFIAFLMTFFDIFDLPVFWPLLLIYFLFATLNIGIR